MATIKPNDRRAASTFSRVSISIDASPRRRARCFFPSLPDCARKAPADKRLLAGLCMAYFDQPTEPSKLMPISFCVSAMNSMGRLLQHVPDEAVDDQCNGFLPRETALHAVEQLVVGDLRRRRLVLDVGRGILGLDIWHRVGAAVVADQQTEGPSSPETSCARTCSRRSENRSDRSPKRAGTTPCGRRDRPSETGVGATRFEPTWSAQLLEALAPLQHS